MENRLLEMEIKLGEGVVYTIRWFCRSVCNHLAVVVCVCFLLFLYRSFPFIFSLWVSAFPVLVCTAVLLGILLSYGQPNIPEIEIEERRTDDDIPTKAGVSGDVNVDEKNERCYAEGFNEERREGLEQLAGKLGEPCGEHALDESHENALLIDERSRYVQLGDGEIREGNIELGELGHDKMVRWSEVTREAKVVENHFASIVEGDEENDESDGDDSEAESFGSKEVNVDSLDSPPRSPWARVDGMEEDDGLDSGSDRAESSSPDASMAKIMSMLDELHPLLDDEIPQPVPVSLDGSDAASERSSTSSHDSDDENESHMSLNVSDNDDEDGGKDEEEEQIDSAVTWTAEDQNNLMELRNLEIERNQRLENLIIRRSRDRNLDNGIENFDDVDDKEAGVDEEDGHEDKEEQTGSPIAWTEQDQKNLMEMRSSEIERNLRLENIIMTRAREHKLNSEIENHNDVDVDDGEDEEDAQEDKEEETKSPIAWTEKDQKNVMDLGWSEIERNQRLENLILRRRARKNMSRNLALESYDLPFNVVPISTTRKNPFAFPDYSYNDSGLPPIPGSAPSVLLPRRNPFDIPYDSSEEKPDLLGDEFQKEFTTPVQPREPIFRRYESVNARTSRFARQRQVEQEMKMRPFFVPEHSFSEESSSSQFQRQSSELSDSKVSSIHETDSVSSFEELGNRKLPEEDDSLEVEPSSGSIEFIEEYRPQEPEAISIVESVAELVRHGSESSSSEEDAIELGQVEQRNVEVSEISFQSEDVEDYDHQEHMEAQRTEYHSISDLVEQRYSSSSSSSSLSKVSERVVTETTGGEGLLRDSFHEEPDISFQALVEHTALTNTSTLVDEVPYEVPIYDLSPSLSSTEVHPASDPGSPQVLVKRTVSSIENESKGPG